MKVYFTKSYIELYLQYTNIFMVNYSIFFLLPGRNCIYVLGNAMLKVSCSELIAIKVKERDFTCVIYIYTLV